MEIVSQRIRHLQRRSWREKWLPASGRTGSRCYGGLPGLLLHDDSCFCDMRMTVRRLALLQVFVATTHEQHHCACSYRINTSHRRNYAGRPFGLDSTFYSGCICMPIAYPTAHDWRLCPLISAIEGEASTPAEYSTFVGAYVLESQRNLRDADIRTGGCYT